RAFPERRHRDQEVSFQTGRRRGVSPSHDRLFWRRARQARRAEASRNLRDGIGIRSMIAGRLAQRLRAAARAPIGAALALAVLGAPALADPFSTDWAAGPKSEARLIAASRDLAGFE